MHAYLAFYISMSIALKISRISFLVLIVYGNVAVSDEWGNSLPADLMPYEARSQDNPYLRAPDYYGLDKLKSDEALWSEIFDNVRIPLLTTFRMSPFYNSNALLNNQRQLGSFGTFITPSLTLPFGNARHTGVVNYTMMASLYEAVPKNNYVGNALRASTTLNFNARNRLSLTAGGTFGYDPLGTMFTQGYVANELKEASAWTGYSFNANYQYGVIGAKGLLNFRFGLMGREYTNNLALMSQRDTETYNLGVSLLVRVLPKTRLLFEVNDAIINYPNSLNIGGNLSGSNYRIYTGATWVPSVKTQAVFKLGYQYHAFDDPSLKGQGGIATQAMLGWSPRERDNLSIQINNSINEALISGSNSVNTITFGTNWSHKWLERVSSHLGASFTNQDYTGNNIQNQTITLLANANYLFRHNMNFSLQYRYSDRLSNTDQFTYNQNMVMINFNTYF
jgi:hypothetical protein